MANYRKSSRKTHGSHKRGSARRASTVRRHRRSHSRRNRPIQSGG